MTDDITIDLGHGHTARPYTTDGADGQTVGYTIHHPHAGNGYAPPRPDGSCVSAVRFDIAWPHEASREFWHVEAWNPLTINPSVLCRLCGDHGFIRDGKWVPA